MNIELSLAKSLQRNLEYIIFDLHNLILLLGQTCTSLCRIAWQINSEFCLKGHVHIY